jgi:hypothetical protein
MSVSACSAVSASKTKGRRHARRAAASTRDGQRDALCGHLSLDELSKHRVDVAIGLAGHADPARIAETAGLSESCTGQ